MSPQSNSSNNNNNNDDIPQEIEEIIFAASVLCDMRYKTDHYGNEIRRLKCKGTLKEYMDNTLNFSDAFENRLRDLRENLQIENVPPLNNNNNNDNKKKIYKCKIEGCKKSYKKNSHLIIHVRKHTGERPYVCQFEGCDKSFSRSDELTRHNRIHTGEKNHICHLCPKKFMRSDHLKKHVSRHQNDKDAKKKKRKTKGRSTIAPKQ